MCTWTSSRARRAALAAALAAILPGCLPDALVPGAAPVADPPPGPTLLADAVSVSAPAGWCPDTRAGRSDETGSFLLFAPCRANPPPSPAILTISVLGAVEAGAVDPARLESFFRSEIGRAALSRSGDADSLRVLQTGVEGDGFFLHVRDTADLPGAQVAPEAWRAVLPLSGRLVALTALSPAEPRVPPATLRAVLDAFVAEMRAVNAPLVGG